MHCLNSFEGLKTHYATWSRTLLAFGLVSAGPRLPLSPTIPGTLPIARFDDGYRRIFNPASLKQAQRSIQAMQKNQELPPENAEALKEIVDAIRVIEQRLAVLENNSR